MRRSYENQNSVVSMYKWIKDENPLQMRHIRTKVRGEKWETHTVLDHRTHDHMASWLFELLP